MKDKTTQETKSKLDKYYGESVPSTVYKQFDYSRSGRMTTNNAEHSGQSVELTTAENIEKNP